MQLEASMTRGLPCRKGMVCAALLVLLSACGGPKVSIQRGNTPQQERAFAMWNERCKKAGVFIHRTVENVEGIYLVNVRTESNQGDREGDQFRLSDPYGNDGWEDYYLINFLEGAYHQRPAAVPRESWGTPRIGYRYVEAVDYKDGRLTRYTSRLDRPDLRAKGVNEWFITFMLDRTPIPHRSARYGVKFEDISTRAEREHWIAGSSLKVIDLETQEVLGERIGYMVDWAQGSRAGGRQPWTFAASNACPSFIRNPNSPNRRGADGQPGQTLDFVEKVLKPIRREQ
jgi:hypothetical protein